MKQAGLLFLLIAALAFASCRPTARQTVADVEPDKYDFERGQEYRIVKEFFKRARTGIPHRQRVLQEREEGTAKRLLLFFI